MNKLISIEINEIKTDIYNIQLHQSYLKMESKRFQPQHHKKKFRNISDRTSSCETTRNRVSVRFVIMSFFYHHSRREFFDYVEKLISLVCGSQRSPGTKGEENSLLSIPNWRIRKHTEPFTARIYEKSHTNANRSNYAPINSAPFPHPHSYQLIKTFDSQIRERALIFIVGGALLIRWNRISDVILSIVWNI